MSRASDWAKKYRERPDPFKTTGDKTSNGKYIAEVKSDGDLYIYLSHIGHLLTARDALKFRDWLSEMFDESTSAGNG